MVTCEPYPPHLNGNLCFYITQVVATPVVFGAGIVGNVVCMMVFNHKLQRHAHPAYAYLNGLCILDFLSLCVMIPKYVQDCEALPVEQTHARSITFIVNGMPGVGRMCTHSSTWYVVMATVVYLARYSKVEYKPAWTKISISRIVAFVIFAAAGLLNFPEFFAYTVKKVENHCLEGVELWGLFPTQLAKSIVYTSLYPWILTGIVFVIPFAILTILAMTLPIIQGFNHFCRTSVLKNASSDDDKRTQLGKTLFILTIVYLVLELPANLGALFLTVNAGDVSATNGFYEMALVAELLRRLRLVLPFVIYALNDSEFRKNIRRVLCCSGDEFYEPCACCCPSLLEQAVQESDWARSQGVYQGRGVRGKPGRDAGWL